MFDFFKIFVTKAGDIFIRKITDCKPDSIGCVEVQFPENMQLHDVEKSLELILESIRKERISRESNINKNSLLEKIGLNQFNFN